MAALPLLLILAVCGLLQPAVGLQLHYHDVTKEAGDFLASRESRHCEEAGDKPVLATRDASADLAVVCSSELTEELTESLACQKVTGFYYDCLLEKELRLQLKRHGADPVDVLREACVEELKTLNATLKLPPKEPFAVVSVFKGVRDHPGFDNFKKEHFNFDKTPGWLRVKADNGTLHLTVHEVKIDVGYTLNDDLLKGLSDVKCLDEAQKAMECTGEGFGVAALELSEDSKCYPLFDAVVVFGKPDNSSRLWLWVGLGLGGGLLLLLAVVVIIVVVCCCCCRTRKRRPTGARPRRLPARTETASTEDADPVSVSVQRRPASPSASPSLSVSRPTMADSERTRPSTPTAPSASVDIPAPSTEESEKE